MNKYTFQIVLALILLSACGQEPNTTPSPEPTASPTPGVMPSPTPEATPTPSPLPKPTPSPTPLTQVEVQDITSELFTEKQDTLHSLIVKGSKDDLRVAVIWDYDTAKMTQIHYPTHQVKTFTIQNLSPYHTTSQVASHSSGIIFANDNCLELFSLEDNTSTPYVCSPSGKKIQGVYTAQNNTLYSFGQFVPPEKLKQLAELAHGSYSERLSQSINSSAYHLTEHSDKRTYQELFTTHPVGGSYLLNYADAYGEGNSWGIPPLKGWQNIVSWENLSIKNVYYILNNYAKEPYISVSNDSKNTPLPPDIPSKIPYIQDGPVAQATLWQPHHLTVDSQQNVYFIDQFITQNKRFSYIRHIAQGQVKTLIAQTRSTGEFFPQADFYLSDLSSNATPDQYADYITLIALNETDQTLYIATSTGELFSFDLNAQKLTLISEDIPHDLKDLEIGPEGDLYAINDSSLFHIRIPESLKIPETAPS